MDKLPLNSLFVSIFIPKRQTDIYISADIIFAIHTGIPIFAIDVPTPNAIPCDTAKQKIAKLLPNITFLVEIFLFSIKHHYNF